MKKSQRLGIQKIVEKPRRKKGIIFYLLELVVILFVVGAIALGGLAWRVSSSPLDIGFAKEKIEAQLRDAELGMSAKTKKLALHWPDLDGPLYLWADGVNILNRDGTSVLSMNKVALSLSIPKLFIGQIYPTALIIKEPELSVTRDRKGEFDIGFGVLGSGPSVETESDVTLAQQILQFVSENDGVHNPLSGLNVVNVQDARILYKDLLAQKEFAFEAVDLRFGEAAESVYLSLDLVLKDDEGAGKGAAVSAKFVIPQDGEALNLKADIRNFEVSLLSRYLDELDSFEDQRGAFDFK
ncbi:hypothetical protein N9Z27_02220, partial [Alphaproteobacteria bacterium]|nr:hypothetical protein [Alphaproteobacteria bacterium]